MFWDLMGFGRLAFAVGQQWAFMETRANRSETGCLTVSFSASNIHAHTQLISWLLFSSKSNFRTKESLSWVYRCYLFFTGMLSICWQEGFEMVRLLFFFSFFFSFSSQSMHICRCVKLSRFFFIHLFVVPSRVQIWQGLHPHRHRRRLPRSRSVCL